MALLPLVLIPMPEVKDLFNSIAVKHATYLVVTRRLFLATHLARSIHKYATYRHIDPSHVANVHSMELWSAPCKPTLFLQSRLRRTARLAVLCLPPPPFPDMLPSPPMSDVHQSLTHPHPPKDSAYCCAITLLSLLPFQRKNPTVPNFTVCGTIISPTNERSAQHRASLLSRLTRTDTSLYILYVIYAAIPLFHRLFLGPPFPFPSLLLKLLACVIGVSKPVSYMIWPPTAPGWDALTVEDGNGIKRPRRAKGGKGEAQGWTRGSWLVGLSFDLLIIWLCSVA